MLIFLKNLTPKEISVDNIKYNMDTSMFKSFFDDNKEEIISMFESFMLKNKKKEDKEDKKVNKTVKSIYKILEEIKNNNCSIKQEIIFIYRSTVYCEKNSKIQESTYDSFEDGKYLKFIVSCDENIISSVKEKLEHDFYKIIKFVDNRLAFIVKLD